MKQINIKRIEGKRYHEIKANIDKGYYVSDDEISFIIDYERKYRLLVK